MYLSISTLPDILFAVSQLSSHLDSPGILHCKACRHLLRYIRGTLHLGVTFSKGNLGLSVYCDADYANCVDSRRLYSGYAVLLGSGIVLWRSAKQSTVSTSTTEAEYKALYKGVQEAVWFSVLLTSLLLPLVSPISVYCDNQGAIALAGNPMYQR